MVVGFENVLLKQWEYVFGDFLFPKERDDVVESFGGIGPDFGDLMGKVLDDDSFALG